MSGKCMGGDALVTCPYDPVHRIIHHRLQTHLVKCKKNHPNMKSMTCIYNSTHIIPEVEFNYHLETCKDKYLLDRTIYVPDDDSNDKHPVVIKEVQTEESWDDVVVPTYDPLVKCLSAPILRKKDVAPKSERRGFRMEERERFQKLDMKDTAKPKKVTAPSLAVQTSTSNSTVVENDPEHIRKFLDLKLSDKEEATVQPQPPAHEKNEWFEVVRGRGRGRLPNNKK